MRFSLLLIGGLLTVAASGNARGDEYRWCSNYGSEGGAISCSFITLQQCQAAVSGVGGFCMPNSLANRKPLGAQAQSRRKKHSS